MELPKRQDHRDDEHVPYGSDQTGTKPTSDEITLPLAEDGHIPDELPINIIGKGLGRLVSRRAVSPKYEAAKKLVESDT